MLMGIFSSGGGKIVETGFLDTISCSHKRLFIEKTSLSALPACPIHLIILPIRCLEGGIVLPHPDCYQF